MSASQRVSRGFHRLGLFLAAIPLLVGGALVITSAIDKVPEFSWLSAFAASVEWLGLAITLAVTLAVYGLVRTIGWVIGGFAAWCCSQGF